MPGELVPAVGGTRRCRHRTRSRLTTSSSASGCDQHMPGLVDGYFGPADLKARVDIEQLRSPRRLLDDIASLEERVTARSRRPTATPG